MRIEVALNFCTKCGRPRTSSRFCGGCGNDFGQQADGSGSPLADAPVEQPRRDASPDATRVETPGPAQVPTGPNPFAPRAPGPPPAHAAPRRGSGAGGKRTAFIAMVLLVVLATGGGAYALVSRSDNQAAARPSGAATVTAHASTAAPAASAVQASTSPTTPTTSASASPSTTPSASATPSPTHTGTVQAAAGVAGNPAAPQVEAFLNRYFNSINTRNYGEYNSLLDAQRQQGDSQSTFESGYATTRDTNEALTGISDTGGGDLTVNVSFTSHQNPADSPDKSACDDWQISLFLVPQGASYVMTATPADYHASDTAC